MDPFGNTNLNPNFKYGIISTTNVGRRPIYISHAHIKIIDTNEIILPPDFMSGTKLAEGDPPVTYTIQQTEVLKQYSTNWKKMRAVVIDSAGKEYISNSIKTKPTWVLND